MRRRRAFDDVTWQRLRGSALAENGAQLDALANLGPALLVQVLDAMESRGATTVQAGKAAVLGTAPVQDIVEVMFLRYLKIWDAAPLALRKRIAAHSKVELSKSKGEAA
jgi:hypothetical protein